MRSERKKKILLLVVSLTVSTICLEAALRVLGLPINNIVPHEILEYTLRPSLASIDEDGFRNPSVLTQADIVTLGDSHTYGQNVESDASWPQQLARLTGQRVYNFGVGGYGMLQYYYLLDKAIALKPQTIVIGALFANDLSDVIKLVMRQPYWRAWCKERETKLLDVTADPSQTEKYVKKKSSWIKNTAISCLYEDIIRPKILRRIFPKKKDGIRIKDDKNTKLLSSKRTKAIGRYTDFKRPEISAAYTLTKTLLREMKEKCDTHNIRLCILLIPSMESVFYPYLVDRQYDLPQEFHLLAENESEIMDDISTFFDEQQIDYVKILDPLREKVETQGGIYPKDSDGHPFAAGYAVYAEGVYQCLQRHN